MVNSYQRRARWKGAGQKIKALRLGMGLSQKEFIQKLEQATGERLYTSVGCRSVRKLEAGELHPSRCHLIAMLKKVFQLSKIQAINGILRSYEYCPLIPAEANSLRRMQPRHMESTIGIPLQVLSATRPDLHQIGLSIYSSLNTLGLLRNPAPNPLA